MCNYLELFYFSLSKKRHRSCRHLETRLIAKQKYTITNSRQPAVALLRNAHSREFFRDDSVHRSPTCCLGSEFLHCNTRTSFGWAGVVCTRPTNSYIKHDEHIHSSSPLEHLMVSRLKELTMLNSRWRQDSRGGRFTNDRGFPNLNRAFPSMVIVIISFTYRYGASIKYSSSCKPPKLLTGTRIAFTSGC